MNGGRESHSACFQAFHVAPLRVSLKFEGALNPYIAPFAFCFPVSPLCCGIGGLHKKNLVLGWLRTVIISTQLYETISYLQKKMRKNTKENFTLVHKLVKNSVIIFTKHFAVS